MTRPLRAVSGPDFVPALRAALDGSGPAVFAGEAPAGLPAEVARRVSVVVQSSGSSGRPKRVALSADALLASAAASESALGGPGQWLLALPTTYIAGINVLVRSAAADTEPVILDPSGFTAERFAEAAARLDQPLRFTSLVPTQLHRLLESDAATAALRRFDRVLLGGQATPAALLELATERGIRVTRTYGSSETSGGCVYDGVPIGSTQVRIVDGEIQLAGPVLAEGYLDDPERTDATFLVDAGQHWYRTGDAGTLVDGVLAVTGRLDDVIISGGLKVSLGEVEAVVRSLPGLGDAVVVAAPSDEWGETPVVVTTADGASLEDVRAAVAEALGRHAAPARIVSVAGIPQLSSGKPDRVALRLLAAPPR
ncbi:o-succinylbenzoate--CoA ligase [Glaciihabitans arcticus]|uniref:O-succinylbenzoate--CoA ligase n=1 Tax=Glaciihabitans arcticus TaxID=2668039 RepID=A0A4Q9GUL1_9MICO|nr:AMP-binding protein [Glaciihabitans arcticus]TBN58445.1 o-succinylbenzoate--CoA ligase [Glaciihabitans arcticus]